MILYRKHVFKASTLGGVFTSALGYCLYSAIEGLGRSTMQDSGKMRYRVCSVMGCVGWICY
jgi:hypothetical protein